MKSFFKFTFASILGVLVGLFLFILIVLGIFSAASKEKPVTVDANTVLYTEFGSPIVDRHPESPFEYINPMNFMPESRLGLDMILENIEKAKENDNISGIVMNLDIIPAGLATLNEIRNALIDFKSEGKFIMCFSSIYTQSSYFLATAADEVYITPEGSLPILGLSAETIFFTGLFDKIGVEMQVFKAGEYKGAIEPFIYKELSDENRQQIKDYLTSMWEYMADDIAEARNISVEELNELASNLEIFSASDAYKYNLVDGMLYYDEFIDKIKELTETAAEDDVKTISFSRLNKVPKERKVKGLARDKIAVVYATGSITEGEGSTDIIGGDNFARTIRKARRDSSIKAIVLRVNSPGGAMIASDVIWREVKLAAEVKPVIASMGDVAASGGYHIVAPATKIIANPNTITGSIGVFGVFPNAQEFFNDKLGMTSDIVKTNEHADLGFLFRPLDEREKQKFANHVDKAYKQFVSVVAEGRGMSYAEIDAIARGHVYTGIDAKEIGLVDELGGLDKAIEVAVEAAELETWRIVKLPEIEDPFEKIINDLTGSPKAEILKEELGEYYIYYKKAQEIKSMEGIQARMPYELIIK